MQIDRNDENGRSTLLTNIGWRKDNKRNILNAIVEIKDYMYHNGDSLKEAYKKFSNQSEYAPVIKGQLKGWAANKKAFLDSRSNRRSTTLYDLTKRVELACRFLEKSPKPQNAKDLFLRIKEVLKCYLKYFKFKFIFPLKQVAIYLLYLSLVVNIHFISDPRILLFNFSFETFPQL